MKEIKEFEDVLDRIKATRFIENEDERNAAFGEIFAALEPCKQRVFEFYAEAKERENDLIDINVWSAGNVPMLLEELRGCGITHITVSSSWSGLPELMWAFVENDCTVMGMVQINRYYRDWKAGKFPKMPAFLVKIQED